MNKRIISLLTLLIIGAIAANACSCANTILEKEIDSTPLIFIGQAVEIRSFKQEVNGYSMEFQETTFSIVETFKGSESEVITIITDPYESSCGFSFDRDSTYIIFASKDYISTIFNETKWSTGYCTSTESVSRRSEMLSKLKKIKSSIESIAELSPEQLYLDIWKDERFIWTQESESLQLSEEELDNFKSKYLTYCETDSILPKDSFDSSMVKSNLWNYKPSMVYVTFDIDQSGKISNLSVTNDQISKDCQNKAIEFVYKLGPWKPASIRGVNVKSRGLYLVDFNEKESR